MKDTIIERAPDNMINYDAGFIFLAYRDTIVYCNVSQYGIDDDDEAGKAYSNFVHE